MFRMASMLGMPSLLRVMLSFNNLIVVFRSLYTFDHSETSSLAAAIGTWGFSAHEYSEEQLVQAAFLMLNHGLDMPELEKWRLPAGKSFRWITQSRQHARTR